MEQTCSDGSLVLLELIFGMILFTAIVVIMICTVFLLYYFCLGMVERYEKYREQVESADVVLSFDEFKSKEELFSFDKKTQSIMVKINDADDKYPYKTDVFATVVISNPILHYAAIETIRKIQFEKGCDSL